MRVTGQDDGHHVSEKPDQSEAVGGAGESHRQACTGQPPSARPSSSRRPASLFVLPGRLCRFF